MADAIALRLFVMDSGEGIHLQTLLEACGAGRLDAEVVGLASEKKCPAIHIAEEVRLPIVFHPWGPYKVAGKLRETYDRDLAFRIWSHAPDLVVLTDWPRTLSAGFLEVFPERAVRLHPALPGTFMSKFAVAETFDACHRDEIQVTGAALHWLDANPYNLGPVISQTRLDISAAEPFEAFKARLSAAAGQVLLQGLAALVAESS